MSVKLSPDMKGLRRHNESSKWCPDYFSLKALFLPQFLYHVINDVITLLIRHTWGTDEKGPYCNIFKDIPKSHYILMYSYNFYI